MITAVDSSALIAVYKGETIGAAWLDLLQVLGNAGQLTVCEVVFAEIAALIGNEAGTFAFFADLGMEYDSIQPKTAVLAGNIFAAYRRVGGPRQHLIPDFLIGAHASVQASQLAAGDQGYLRRYFPKLKVISPQ